MISTDTEPAPAPDRSADEWFGPWRFAALLAALIVACFPQVIAGLETFFYRDYSAFGYPLAFYHRETFWQGEIPLWNPYNNCGLPFLAQWNTLTLYPGSLIYLLLPLPWSLGMFCLGHLFFAGLGMYFLARRWTGNGLAAAIAGTAYAFNGVTWHWLAAPSNIAALSWIPWTVFAVERGWRKGGRAVLLAGVVGALQLLAAVPELILETWFVIGLLGLVQLVRREVSWPAMIGRTVCMVGIAAALAAVQLLPFLDLLRHSHRDAGFGDSSWSMPASGWGNYLVPLLHDTPAGRGVYVQHDQFWTSSYFLGVGVVALALLALWRMRNWRVWALAALTLFSLSLALGNHGVLFGLLRKIAPQIGFMRYPIKFVVLATFAIPLLAAHGLAWFQASERRREWRQLAGLGGVLLAVMTLITWYALAHPQPGDEAGTTIRSALRSGIFLALILGCAVWLQRCREARTKMLLQCALMVLAWFDVFMHVPTLSPTVSTSVYEPGLIRTYLKWDARVGLGGGRAMPSEASLFKMTFGAVNKASEDVFGHRLTLFDNLNLLDHAPKLDGFYSLYLREMNTVVGQMYFIATNDPAGLKDFLGVAEASNPTNSLEWTARESSLPLVTAGQEPVFAGDEAAFRKMFETSFDSRKTVYLPPAAKSSLRPAAHGAARIMGTKFSAERLEIQVEAAESPAMVVVAQAYYHPWHAYVDGAPTPLLRANYAFQALEVPPGPHRVVLAYEDRAFRIGSAVSLTAALVCIGMWLVRRKPAMAAA